MKTKGQKLLLLNLIMLIFLSEVTLFSWPLIGIFVNAFILTFLLMAAAFAKVSRNLLVCLSTIPAARLIGFLVPQADTFLRTTLFYYSALILSFGYLFHLRIKKTGHNLKGIENLPLMIMAGVLLGSLEYAILPKECPNPAISLGSAVPFFLFFGYTEELLFRGLIQNSAAEFTKPLSSVLFTSILYTFVHLNSGLYGVALALLTGLATSIVFQRTRNIFLVTALNTTVNLLVFSLVTGILEINL